VLRGRAAFVALAVSGALVLVLVLVAVVVALPPSLSSESSRSISATDGGIVAIGDQLTVRIPAGALSADSTVTIRRATDATRPTATLEAGIAVGGAHTIELSEATLQRPVVLEIAFDPAKLPKGSPREIVFAASYDEAAQRWVPVYGRVDPTRNVVIIETDHLSWWQPWTWDIPKLVLAISLRIEKLGSVIGIPTPEIPRCAALPLHTTYESSSALIGCLERTGNEGEALVRLANNRLYGILIDPPAGARHLSTSRGSFSDAVWAQVVPALQGRLVYVPPAGEARFILSLNKGDEVRFLSIISNKTLAFDIGLVIPDLLGWDPKSARAILPCAFPFGGPAQPVSVSSSLALEVLRECAGVALEAEADSPPESGECPRGRKPPNRREDLVSPAGCDQARSCAHAVRNRQRGAWHLRDRL